MEKVQKDMLKVLGWSYIAIGLVCNPWVLGWLGFTEGKIYETRSLVIAGIFAVAMLALGILSVNKQTANLTINLNLLFWSTVIFAPLLGEAVLRAGIALDVKILKNPALYADAASDTEYWKLYRDWGGQYRCVSPDRIHPLLGWSQDYVTSTNPFGLRRESRTRLDSPNPKLFFYGDSFVDGVSDEEFQIPNYINRKIDGRDVVDLSMGGYGLDQIYLMFKETHRKADHPLILVGILVPADMDRNALSVRTSEKPYFMVDASGSLQLEGVPIGREQANNCHDSTLSIKSYLLALVNQTILRGENKVELKQKISSRLLDGFKAEADQAQITLVFVLFYDLHSLTRMDWRDAFLKAELSRLRMPYIDTRNLLLHHAKAQHVELSTFYQLGNGHHNNLGNEVISKGILEYFGKNDRYQQAVVFDKLEQEARLCSKRLQIQASLLRICSRA